MSNRIEGLAHLAGQTLRTVSYAALSRYAGRRAARYADDGTRVEITRPVPGLLTLLQDVLKLQAKDARNVRDGLYPIPVEDSVSFAGRIEAVRRMLDDIPQSAGRGPIREPMRRLSCRRRPGCRITTPRIFIISRADG